MAVPAAGLQGEERGQTAGLGELHPAAAEHGQQRGLDPGTAPAPHPAGTTFLATTVSKHL